MVKKCFLFAGMALALASCKKDDPAQVDDYASCSNNTYYAPDSLMALTTEARSNSTRVVKIQDGAVTVLAAQTNYEFWGPVISPDKQRFICFRSTSLGNSVKVNDYDNAELWMFNIDGSNGHVITTKNDQGWMAMGMADWAADGVHIVLAAKKVEAADMNKPHWSIFITDTTGAPAIKMNSRIGHFTHPRFANGSSSLITYTALPVGLTEGDNFKCEIFYASVNASWQLGTENQATADGMYDYSPSFSPDNARICFTKTTSYASGTAQTLHIYEISSNTNTTIVSDNTINDNPYWCPVNNRIYYTNRESNFCAANCRRVEPDGANITDYFRTMNANLYSFSVK